MTKNSKTRQMKRAKRQRNNRPAQPQLPLGLPFRPPRQSVVTISWSQEVKVPINQNVRSDSHFSFYPLNPGTLSKIAESVSNARDYRILNVSAWAESATASSTQFIGLGNAFQASFQEGHSFRELINVFRSCNRNRRSVPGGSLQIRWGIPNSPWKLISNKDEVTVPALFFGVTDFENIVNKIALFEFTLTVQYITRDV